LSTSQTPVTPATPPDKLQSIFSIINLAMQGLSMFVPGSAQAVLIAGILTHALQAWHAETGQPIDLTKIPEEIKLA